MLIADCQLQTLDHATEAPMLQDRMRNVALRLLSALERRVARLRELLGGRATSAGAPGREGRPENAGTPPGDAAGPLAPGEMVEVRSLAEIERTLDPGGMCDRLQFMEGMSAYCGRRLVVRRPVRTIFDERARRMVRLRDCFILEDAICRGEGMYDKEGCDRSCFFFWKRQWLRKAVP